MGNVDLVKQALELFAGAYPQTPADKVVIEQLRTSLSSGTYEVEFDSMAISTLGAIPAYIRRLLDATTDRGSRFAAADAISNMAAKVERHDVSTYRAIRNLLPPAARGAQ